MQGRAKPIRKGKSVMLEAGIFPSGNSSLELNRTAKGTYTWSMKVYFPKADKHNLQLVIRRVVSCKNLLEKLLGQAAEVEVVMPEAIDTGFPNAVSPEPGTPFMPPEGFGGFGGVVAGKTPPRGLFAMFQDVLEHSDVIDDMFQWWQDIKDIGADLPRLKKLMEEEKAKADAAAEEPPKRRKEKKPTGKRQFTKEKVEGKDKEPAEPEPE